MEKAKNSSVWIEEGYRIFSEEGMDGIQVERLARILQLQKNQSFYAKSQLIDQRVNVAVQQLWCDYLNLSGRAELGIRYYSIIRDMFYTRISFQNLNYDFLHKFVSDAKSIVIEISDGKVLESDKTRP